MSEVVRPYRGVSADARRGRRRAELLAACLDVVGAVGVAATTVDAVCARARLSKRYFYESFADREAILVAALESVFESVRTAITAALDEPVRSRQERISRTVRALVGVLTADQRAARLYAEAAHHPALELRRAAAFDEFAQLLVVRVLLLDPRDVRSRLVALLIVAGTTEVLSRWLAGELAMDETELVRAISAIGASAATAH